MKRQTLSLLLFLLPLLLSAAPITKEQALQKAREFANARLHKAKGKKLVAASTPKSEGIEMSSETPGYFVFNVGESQGFIVVSGDDRVPAILGYSDKGSFEADKLPTNVRKWFEEYEHQISLLDKYPAAAQQSIALHETIEPMVKSTWDQDAPYYNHCPIDPETGKISYTGCGATAMAQVMNYYKYPAATASIIPAYTTDHNGINLKAIPRNKAIDWANMLDHYDGNATKAQQDAVADLMLMCGQSIKMDYSSNGSGAYARDVSSAMYKYFGYDKNIHYVFRYYYHAAEMDSMVYHELKNKRPIIYAGTSLRDGTHAFIVDGYSEGFYHVNWGWSGACDGYFNLFVLDPDFERSDHSTSILGFNFYNECIAGIQPPTEGETETPLEAVSLTAETFMLMTYDREFTRQANGTFSLPSAIRMINLTSITRSYEIGYAIFNTKNEMVHAASAFKENNIAPMNDVVEEVKLSVPADLPDGEYTAKVINRPVNTEEWLVAPGFESVINLTIKGNVLTAVSFYPYNLSGTFECLTENPQLGKRLVLEAKVTSRAGNCVAPMYFEVDGEWVGSTDVDVAAGETQTITLNYQPTRSGINKLRLISASMDGFVAAEGTINVKGAESTDLLFNLGVKDQRKDNSVPHTNVEVTARIHNNSCNAYNKRIILSLSPWNEEEQGYEKESIAKEIDLALEGDADCEKVITFEGLDNHCHYALSAIFILEDGMLRSRTKEICYFYTNEAVDGKEDMTYLLENPDFEWGDYGWNIDAVSGGNVRVGGTGENYCFEAWNNREFDIHQTVTDLPAGIYEIEVQGFYRNRRDDNAWNAYQQGGITVPVYVYLNNSATPFKNVFDEPAEAGLYSGDYYYSPTGLYFPNDMATAAQAFSAGMYRQQAYGLVMSENDVVSIGVKGATNQNNDSWAIWDNFKLTYLGFDPKYIRPALQQALNTADGLSGQVMGKTVCQQLVDAMGEAEQALSSTDGELMFQVLNRLYTVSDEAVASATTFQRLLTALDELQWALDHYDVASAAVKQACTDEHARITANARNHEYESDDIDGLIAQIEAKIALLRMPENMAQATATAPVECTTLLNTPSFERDGENWFEGWYGQGYFNYGNDEFQCTSLAVEVYQNTFSLFQPLYDLPNGYYAMQVSAFYRYGSPEQDAEHYRQGEEPEHVIIFMSDLSQDGGYVAKPVVLMSSGVSEQRLSTAEELRNTDGLYVPNDMVSSVAYFKQGHYQNNLLFNVKNNCLLLGIQKTATFAEDWVIMDDFRLFYYGTERPSDEQLGIAPIAVASPTATPAEYFDLSGRRLSTSQKGFTIRRQQQPDGTVLVRKVVK